MVPPRTKRSTTVRLRWMRAQGVMAVRHPSDSSSSSNNSSDTNRTSWADGRNADSVVAVLLHCGIRRTWWSSSVYDELKHGHLGRWRGVASSITARLLLPTHSKSSSILAPSSPGHLNTRGKAVTLFQRITYSCMRWLIYALLKLLSQYFYFFLFIWHPCRHKLYKF